MPARKKKKFGCFVKAALAAAASVVLLIALHRYILISAHRFLEYSTPIKNADVIYVYAGNPMERPIYAAKLFKEGRAPRAAVGGVLVHADLIAIGRLYNEGSVNRTVLVRAGVPENKIIQIWDGTSTMEETLALRRLLEAQGWRSAILVSTPCHMRRVRFCASRVFDGADYEIIYAGDPDSFIRADSWWRHEQGLVTVAMEYLKLFYYYLKY